MNAALTGVSVDETEVRDTLEVLKGRELIDIDADGLWFEVKEAEA